jgi:hypothetical protein
VTDIVSLAIARDARDDELVPNGEQVRERGSRRGRRSRSNRGRAFPTSSAAGSRCCATTSRLVEMMHEDLDYAPFAGGRRAWEGGAGLWGS